MKKTTFVLCIICLLTGLSIFLSGCKHDPSEPELDCYMDSVTYNSYVKYIIEDKCLGCHTANSIDPTMDTYVQVKAVADDGRLKNVLMGTPGYPSMPYQSERLPDCMIANIVTWIEDGTPM